MKLEFTENLLSEKIEVNGLNVFYGTKNIGFDIQQKIAKVFFTADFWQ